MKCISLWQPWATLMAIGAKRIETRSWETLYRGPLAIHAAKKWNRELEDMCHTEPFRSVLMKERPNAGGMFHDEDALKAILPFGAIVAVVNLDGCYGTQRLEIANANRTREGDESIAKTLRWAGHSEAVIAEALESGTLTDQERAFGDYSVGRYAWLTSQLRRLDTPIPFKGAQGLFDVPDELIAKAVAR